MEIWPFEVLPERLFQEQRSVVGRSVGPQYTLILYTPLRYVRNVHKRSKKSYSFSRVSWSSSNELLTQKQDLEQKVDIIS